MTAARHDLVIIGTGMGGGVLAYALKDSGMKILLIERGDFLPQEPENWSPEAVFDHKRYKPNETWYDETGKPFSPGVHYFVGGNTKVYGAALPRLRKEDFSELEHEEGISPGWPITYEELEPYYERAEHLLAVHGSARGGPPDPPPGSPLPLPPLPPDPPYAAAKEGNYGPRLQPSFLTHAGDARVDAGVCLFQL